MKRAIVAFMVVAGMALMMTGCGQEDTGAKKAAPTGTATPPPAKAPAKAPAEEK